MKEWGRIDAALSRPAQSKEDFKLIVILASVPDD